MSARHAALRCRCPPLLGRLVLGVLAATAALAADAQAPAHYVADPARSRLEFTGVQAGAPFKAVFHKWSASIDFSPEALASSHFDVLIDLASVDSEDKDRDDTIRGPDIFDVAHHPSARYVTRSIQKTSSGYAASGSLTLHGVTRDVPIAFTFSGAGASARLSGDAKLARLDFGVGQGDWKNTDEVKNEVSVAFTLTLVPK